MTSLRLRGLIAATYTPFHPNGSLRLERVPRIVEHLLASGVSGIYVCGSTGEGMSLAGDERRQVAEAYVEAVQGRSTVIVQVGHNSLAEARQLAAHAQRIGADVISATCPSYFAVDGVNVLVDCMAQVAQGAPDLPFYYYHIPGLTGAELNMVEFLEQGKHRIRNLAGLKYTSTLLPQFQRCVELDNGVFDVVWGVDEMLLSALGAGAQGAIGSTFNIAAPLYRQIIQAFESEQLDQARRLQSLAVQMISTIAKYPFHSAMKEVLKTIGFDCGTCRLPLRPLSAAEVVSLHEELDSIGFFEWCCQSDGAALPVGKILRHEGNGDPSARTQADGMR